jgi:hypothetical protein
VIFVSFVCFVPASAAKPLRRGLAVAGASLLLAVLVLFYAAVAILPLARAKAEPLPSARFSEGRLAYLIS